MSCIYLEAQQRITRSIKSRNAIPRKELKQAYSLGCIILQTSHKEIGDELVAKASNRSLTETDLYRPIYDYLVKQGYTVRSEVINCDIAAVKDDELIIIELKRSLNVTLLVQAVERQKITDSVYVAVPRPANKRNWMAQSKGIQHLLRRLELGLIFVSPKRGRAPVEVICHPLPFERHRRKSVKRAVLREIERRSGDFNEGGSCRRKIMTAYRENAIQIACYLVEMGPLQPRKLRALGTGEKTLSILSRNVYSWFERVDRGLYAVCPRCKNELEEYPKLVEYYQDLLKQADAK